MIISASLNISAIPPKPVTISPSSFSLLSRVCNAARLVFQGANFFFSGWKRVILSEAPRQTINALTLYAIFLSKRHVPGSWYDVSRYFVNSTLSASLLTVTTFCTVVVFAGSMLILIAAAICYIPLLCHIRGNLKVGCVSSWLAEL
jgi:hypothetical protein